MTADNKATKFTRRQFMQVVGVGGSSLLLSQIAQRCGVNFTPPVSPTASPEAVIQLNPLTSQEAQKIINTQWGKGVTIHEGNSLYEITSYDIDVNDTYSQVDSSGQIYNPNIKRTGHLAYATNQTNGDKVVLPLIIEYDEATKLNRVFGLAKDTTKSTNTHGEFIFVTHDPAGLVQGTTLRLVADIEEGGVSIRLVNQADNSVTQLGLTPKANATPTAIPTTVPQGIDWPDKIIDIITGADTAFAAEVEATATASPQATSTVAPTQEPTPTTKATEQPTPEIIQYNIEGASQLDKKDLLNGVIEIDSQTEGQYYDSVLASWLSSGVNDEYFQKNFGINDTSLENALGDLKKSLKSKNYVMPAGLKLPIEKDQNLSNKVVELTEFKADTIILQVLDVKTFVQQRLSGEIKGSQFVDLGGLEMGIRMITSTDSTVRMGFLVADSKSDDRVVSLADPSNPHSLNVVNKLVEFFPFLFSNTHNARKTRGIQVMDISNYLNHRANEFTVIDGEYFWRSDPTIKVFKFSSK